MKVLIVNRGKEPKPKYNEDRSPKRSVGLKELNKSKVNLDPIWPV